MCYVSKSRLEQEFLYSNKVVMRCFTAVGNPCVQRGKIILSEGCCAYILLWDADFLFLSLKPF